MHHSKRRGRAIRLATALLLLLLGAFIVVACGDDDDPTPTPTATATSAATTTATSMAAAFPVTITDSSGTTVTIEAAPERIICYSPAATEVLFAVGAGDQVVAVDEFSNYPDEVDALPKLSYSDPAPEPAVAEDPDLVFMAGRQEGQVEQFRALGLTVVLLEEPTDITGVIEQIELVGQLTGHAAEAAAVTSEMETRIAAVDQKVASVTDGPLVFWELTPDGYTVGSDSFIGAMLTRVKAGNVAEGATSAFPQISLEVIVDANPDVILLADGGDAGGQSLETVQARPGWDVIQAVENEQVFVVDADIFSRPGPRVVDALEQLVELLYPGQS